MEHQAITILRYISLLQRNTRRYFDLMLEQDQIGSGQQVFPAPYFWRMTESACRILPVLAALTRVR